MSTKFKTYSDEFKAKVALEALREEMSLNQIAAKYEIHPKNIYNWKSILLANMHHAFNPDKTKELYKDKYKQRLEQIDELHRQIGELHTELAWLKKKSGEAGLGY